MLQWTLRLVLVAAMATVGFVGARLVVPGRVVAAASVPAANVSQPAAIARFSPRDAAVAEALAALAVRPDQVVHLRSGDGSLALHLAAVARGQRFDAIVLSDLLDSLVEPRPLFRALAASLVPDTGRLLIVQPIMEERFFAEDFGPAFRRSWQEGAAVASPPTVLNALHSVVSARLAASARAHLAAPSDANLPDTARRALAKGFDDLLADRGLVPALNAALGATGSGVAQDLTSGLSMAEAAVLQWVVLNFDDHGVVEPEGPALAPLAQAALRTVNGLALAPLFGPRGRAAVDAIATTQHHSESGLYLSEAGLERRLASAGYRRVASPIAAERYLVLAFVRDAGARP